METCDFHAEGTFSVVLDNRIMICYCAEWQLSFPDVFISFYFFWYRLSQAVGSKRTNDNAITKFYLILFFIVSLFFLLIHLYIYIYFLFFIYLFIYLFFCYNFCRLGKQILLSFTIIEDKYLHIVHLQQTITNGIY